MIARLRALVRNLLRRRDVDRDLDDELASYIELRADEQRAAGVSEAQARRRARVELGGASAVAESLRSARAGAGLERAWQDVRYAGRVLRAAPGFTTVAVLTLSLGIGATVTMFSVMHAVLWRPLPYPDADRLIAVHSSAGSASGGLSSFEVAELRESTQIFTRLAQANGVDAFVSVGDQMERVAGASATDDTLELMGAVPLELGRPLRAGIDIRAGKAASVVISDRLWRQMLHADPNVIGRHIQVNNLDVELVGVTRPGLRIWLPGAATPEAAAVDDVVDVWFPASQERGSVTGSGSQAIGRLAPGVSVAQAQARLDALARRLVRDHAEYADLVGPLRFHVEPLRDVITAEARGGLRALGAAALFVLMIACVNVANLMLARAKSREREFAVRSALGASRARILRQMLTEALVLSVFGASGGLLFTRGAIGLLAWLRPLHLPRQDDVSIDLVVTITAVGLASAATVACGLFAALAFSRAPRSGTLLALRSPTATAGRHRLQRALLVAEVACSIVPLIGAGLMLRTFGNLVTTPLGFDPTRIVTAQVAYSLRKFPDVATRWPLHREIVEAVGRLPNVERVSAVSPLPFGRVQFIMRFRRAGDPTDRGYAATRQTVLPGYFSLTGTPLLQGRDFTNDDVDTRRDVAIVDERFARALWDGNAIGRKFLMGAGRGLHVLEVIGLTRSQRTIRVRDEAMPHVFVPYHVSPVELALLVKTNASAAEIGPVIKRTVEALGTGRAVYDTRPMSSYVEDSIDDSRFLMLVLTAFAAVSLVLAGVGLYGTMSYLMSSRTQEFGVRVALGATAGGLVRLVTTESAALIAAGVVLGTAGALSLTSLLRSSLYGVTPFDGITLVGVAGAVVIVGLAALGRPAWRAAHVDPNVALRSE